MSSKFYAHTVAVREAYGRSRERLPLGDLGGKRDLLAIMRDQLLQSGTSWDDSTDTKRARHHGEVGCVCEIPERRLHGRVLAGYSGVRSDLRRPDGSVVHRQVEDVERRPLYFWLNLPRRGTTGLLLVEQHGHLGVRGAFWDQVVTHRFRQLHGDLMLDIAYYYPHRVWEEYERLNGELTGATVVTRLRPPIADNNIEVIGPEKAQIGHLHIAVRRDLRSIARRVVVRMLQGEITREEAVEVLLPAGPDADLVRQMETDEVQIQVVLGDGGRRSVTLGQDSIPRAGYVLDDNVETDELGFPTLDAMAEQARRLETVLLPALDLAS